MGEANRRKRFLETLEIPPQTIDPMTGATGRGEVRRAGCDSTTWRRHFTRNGEQIKAGVRGARQEVPCGSCSACCYIDKVEVNPEKDDVEHLDTERDLETGILKLRKRPDGACIHLGPTGCMVRDHQPMVCRTFDCRVYSVVGLAPKWTDADGNEISGPAWLFDPPKSRADQIYEIACRFAVWRYIETRRKAGLPWETEDAIEAAITGWEAEKPAAIRRLDEMRIKLEKNQNSQSPAP